MRQADLKFISNKSDLIEQNQIIVVKEQTEKFKFSTILNKAFSSWVAKELIRLAAFTIFVFIFLSLINRNSSTTVFSIVSREQNEGSIFTKKQIPGLFPSLSKNWEDLLTRWQLRLLNGPNGAQSFNQNKYQIQFKHFDQKQDVVYITKDNCKGHLIMNWQIYGNNIYFTEFVAPQDSMIIPNDPEDEKCIKQNGTVLELMKFSTVWTISQQNSENSLFLLIQDINENNERANYVLIASESIKV